MLKQAVISLIIFLGCIAYVSGQGYVFLDELDLSKAEQDDFPVMSCKNVKGNPIRLNHVTYEHGLGTFTNSMYHIKLSKGSEKFNAVVGFDDEVIGLGCHPIEFIVYADDRIAWRSGVMKPSDAPLHFEVDIRGTDILSLYVKSVRGKWNGFSAWADACIKYATVRPESFYRQPEDWYILTPKASDEISINGPEIAGVRPNAHFQYYIPVSGSRPVIYGASGLPTGLMLDSLSGILSGRILHPGSYHVVLSAKNSLGTCHKKFSIIVGDTIALTPPMGWNSWNVWATDVSQDKVLQAARAIKNSGLIDYGWSYINIDDGWQGKSRGGKYNSILPNEKFPDMAGLCNQIHALGLKAGIYSTPWDRTYAQYIGSSADCANGISPYYNCNQYRIEFGFFPFYKEDAQQWAEWGFDYLKLDWFPNSVSHTVEFEKALKNTGRDFIYSLSNAAPIEQADYWKNHSNLWRTTGDIVDSWGSVYAIATEQEAWRSFGGPGHWNDPDMLVIGWLGWGRDLHYTRLTPTEQYAHISLWSLMSAPLIIGADLNRLDEFSLNLLSNAEVLDIDQDPLGKPVLRIKKGDLLEIWVKELKDGSRAIGFCNFGIADHIIRLDWKDVGIENEHVLRDVWKQQDLGTYSRFFEIEVKPHGVALYKLK
jgi:alpha-galactosidase